MHLMVEKRRKVENPNKIRLEIPKEQNIDAMVYNLFSETPLKRLILVALC